jgi:hypothetical protein
MAIAPGIGCFLRLPGYAAFMGVRIENSIGSDAYKERTDEDAAFPKTEVTRKKMV